MSETALDRALGLVREVPDFPEPGVLFRDLSPLLADRDGFRAVTDALAATVPAGVSTLVAVEARGFLFGAAMAAAHGYGVVPVRKPGKLPAVAHRATYALEYGTATLELPADVLRPGDRVVVVDDVLATGGTVEAAAGLVRRAGAEVAGVTVVIEIAALGGRARLAPHGVRSLITA
ncbi:adenine phosphoribosyltransferase [Actinokineospora iranica]|uniref:Adenine phosphoribosyltransferase n=1 Tax=Actinokineospora iranica TaxID=1271860 RepID=A0A1G6KNE3_9PSEU|nr:adenine phosphoribosyltransferase [Actinokineospora iranica]SDC32570.1 adenine phosphoribosyltransferase [Actinokineospora iranica]